MRKLLWNLVPVVAVTGFVYCTFEYAEAYGWRGIVIAVLLFALGVMAAELLYPLWFRGK